DRGLRAVGRLPGGTPRVPPRSLRRRLCRTRRRGGRGTLAGGARRGALPRGSGRCLAAVSQTLGGGGALGQGGRAGGALRLGRRARLAPDAGGRGPARAPRPP